MTNFIMADELDVAHTSRRDCPSAVAADVHNSRQLVLLRGATVTLRKAGALPLAYAQLLSMNQLAMLPKAAEVQARIKGQLQAKAASQKSVGTDFDFLLSEEETFKFT